ncbi:TonB-dependent receptor [Microbulbifer pacificus]|uniref:TonB-dependent receptor n=1 Tax=Microbulbifer pacificus TaxID=407164 RepID=UPI000CF447D3|nr:TonB-dependent receptor [Microbulbifer pacificus]
MNHQSLKPLAAAISLGMIASIPPATTLAAPVVEEVTVTATKRAESIQDVPISVSAFSGDYLENSGLNDLEDLGKLAPNLGVTKSSQAVNQRIAIRGVGTVGNNAMDPSVAVYIDGAYVSRPGALLGNLEDIDVAEVLRGPQGTLFGRNAAMGALNLRTRAPVIGEDSIRVKAGAGDYGTFNSSVIANKSLGDNTSARLVASTSGSDGYGENRYDNNEGVGANNARSLKTSLLFEPADNLSVLLRADYQELSGEGPVIEVLPESATPERLATLNYLGAAPDVSGLDHRINQRHQDDMSDRQWGLVLDTTWDDAVAGHTLRFLTSYREWQNRSLEDSVFRLPLEDLGRETAFYSDTFSQEIQLISPTGERFDYVAGLYYFQEDYDIDQTTHLGSAFCPMTGAINPVYAVMCAAGAQADATPSEFTQSAESLAAFVQATYHITDQLDLTLGVRYSDDDKEGSFLVDSNNAIASALLAAPENHQLAFTDNQTTWMANAKYFVTGDIMSYLTVSTGYKSGGLNSVMTTEALNADQRLFDSEDVVNYEFGLKSTLLNGSMVANASIYRTDIENFQDRSFDDLSYVITNAGELRQQGLELDVQYYPLDALQIQFGYAYLDSEFLAFDNGSNLPGESGVQDLAGTPNRYSPEHQANLTSQWTQPLEENGMEWFIRGELSWTDDANVGATTNNNPQTIQQAYALGNLRIGINSAGEDWSISAYVKNIADEKYCDGMFDQPNGGIFGTISNSGTLIRCVQGDPRTVGVSGSYRFQ